MAEIHLARSCATCTYLEQQHSYTVRGRCLELKRTTKSYYSCPQYQFNDGFEEELRALEERSKP
jgi:hypothetical protein